MANNKTKKDNFDWLNVKNVVFSDTETTTLNTDYYTKLVGKKNKKEVHLIDGGMQAEIIELAGMSFNKKGYDGFYSDICKPTGLVQPMSAATHGYTNRMLKDADDLEATNAFKKLRKDVDKGRYLVFHNAPFDVKMLEIHGFDCGDKVIDTLRVARHVYKDGLKGFDGVDYYNVFDGESPENHTLQYFRYLFEMDDQPYFEEAMKMAELTEIRPHTALSDVFILWIFTAKMMHDFNLSLDDMVELSKKPVLLDEISFGKHKGQKIPDVIRSKSQTPWGAEKNDYEYFSWAMTNMSLSVDLEFSINFWMAKAILLGIVPFKQIKSNDFKPFLFNALRGSLEGEDIGKALEIIGKDKSFYEFILDTTRNKTLESLREDVEANEDTDLLKKTLSVRENREFMLNYVETYRRGIPL